MKKKKIIIIVVIVVFLLTVISGVTVLLINMNNNLNEGNNEEELFLTNEDGTIYFEDEKLEKYVKNEIYKDKIYPEDALEVKSLIFTYKKFDSLVGLEHFKNLEKLEIDDCGIEDVSFISKLKSIKYLYLHNNGIYDISPLKKNKNLRYIDISNNNITDISPLDGLDNLMLLPKIHGNSIMNYDLLADNIDKYRENTLKEYDLVDRDTYMSFITNNNKQKCDFNDKECVINLSSEQDNEMMDNYKYAMKVSKEFINNNIKEDMTDIEKEAIISKYIVDWLDYDYDRLSDDYNSEDYFACFKTKIGVCENYSNMFNILANLAGLESYPARSIKEDPFSVGHAWNVVKIDGKYYHVDLTWYDSNRNNQFINASTKTMNSLHIDAFDFYSDNLSRQKISKEDMDRSIIDKYFN